MRIEGLSIWDRENVYFVSDGQEDRNLSPVAVKCSKLISSRSAMTANRLSGSPGARRL